MASKGKNPPKKTAAKKNGYQMPKPLKTGDILSDNHKNLWKIGVSIGVGGFGEIYSACKVDSGIKKVEDYPYVVKIEPKENGPLFVEMHFYMRNAKKEDIQAFKIKHKLKNLGMPEYIAMGSHEIQQIKHRFLVLPRFGSDIWKIFEQNNKKFPLHTAYRICWQVLDVLEYIHSMTYVHMDIKASNILLGFGKGGDEQVYLLDFGLGCHYNTKEFKPDPKKMHNGTIEYTSRDAHQGVPTRRGDIEVLAYNLIDWCGGKLPWVVSKLLAKPVEVQKSKEEFMKNLEKSLKSCFGSDPVPGPVTTIFRYLAGMKNDTVPDYAKIRMLLEAGLKELGQKNSGVLDFTGGAKKKLPAGKPNFGEANLPGSAKKSAPPPAAAKKVKTAKKIVVDTESEDEIPKKPSPGPSRQTKRNREPKRYVEEDSEDDEPTSVNKSPKKKSRAQKSPVRSVSKENHEESSPVSPPQKKTKPGKEKPEKPEKSSKPDNAKGVITLKSKSSSKGKKKTIQLNFNLDVSMNSDLVVVVNRKDKKKPKGDQSETEADETLGDSVVEEKEVNVSGTRAGYYKGKHAKNK